MRPVCFVHPSVVVLYYFEDDFAHLSISAPVERSHRAFQNRAGLLDYWKVGSIVVIREGERSCGSELGVGADGFPKGCAARGVKAVSSIMWRCLKGLESAP
jgi:hypothetical protein